MLFRWVIGDRYTMTIYFTMAEKDADWQKMVLESIKQQLEDLGKVLPEDYLEREPEIEFEIWGNNLDSIINLINNTLIAVKDSKQ